MVCRYGHLYFEIAKGQCKLTTAGKLVILPALEIAIYAKAWIPLGHRKKMVAIFRKIFITAASAIRHTIGYFVVPIQFKNKTLAGF